jgi:SSS family solute:Na+ symporter
MVNGVLVGVGAYLLVQIAIGAYVSRRVASEADYVLAGRSLGVGLGGFSIFATWFGSETVLGAAGRVYSDGLSGAQGEPYAYGLGILLVGALVARPLWKRGLLTFADFFRQRFSPGVERLTVLLLLPGSVLWVAAQVRGFGQVVADAGGIPLATAMLVGLTVIVIYVSLGGLLADAWSDLLQSIIVILGLGAILVAVLAAVGGPGAAIAKIDPARLAPMAEGQAWLAFLEQWAIPICGSIVAIELVSRVLACRSEGVARRATMTGGLLYLGIASVPVFLGLLGPALIPPCSAGQTLGCIAEAERVALALAAAYLPPILVIVFSGALVAAIISTVDSTLVACSAMVSHNLVQPLRPITGERSRLLFVRFTVVALGVVAFLLALTSSGISELVETASAFASAGVFVALVLGMTSPLGGPASAYAAILAGALVWAAGKWAFALETPYLAGLAVAFVAYLAVAGLERRAARSRRAS